MHPDHTHLPIFLRPPQSLVTSIPRKNKISKSNLCYPNTHWSMAKLSVVRPLSRTESSPPAPYQKPSIVESQPSLPKCWLPHTFFMAGSFPGLEFSKQARLPSGQCVLQGYSYLCLPRMGLQGDQTEVFMLVSLTLYQPGHLSILPLIFSSIFFFFAFVRIWQWN